MNINPYYIASTYMGFIAISCFTIIPTILLLSYLHDDLDWEKFDKYHAISFVLGVICSAMSCYLTFKYGVL